MQDSISIIQDFSAQQAIGEDGVASNGNQMRPPSGGGIDGLVVDYANEKLHVEKAKEMVDFEMEGQCTLCSHDMAHDEGLFTICPNPTCQSATHLTCLSKHFLKGQDAILPVRGTCPACQAELRWIDVIKELTLRMRGQKDIEKLLKPKRARKPKETSGSQAITDDRSADEDEDEEMDAMEDELEELREFDQASTATKGHDVAYSLSTLR